MMELVMLASTGFAAAASLAAGVGFGYVTMRATTAALERLFVPAEPASAPGGTVVPFVARQAAEPQELRQAA